MAELPISYIVQNCLKFAYRALKSTERHKSDSLHSPYEDLYVDIGGALSPLKKLDLSIPNSEVEAFYNRRLSENDFISSIQSRILCKVPSNGPGTVVTTGSNPNAPNGTTSTVVSTFNHLSLLFTVVWNLLSRQNSTTCNKLPKLSGRQLWEIFLKLDTESELKVHVDDLVDVILRIFQANGHKEQEENIKEWFCSEEKIDFFSFFSQLTEKYVGLLQIHVVKEVYMNVVCEFLKEGKLEKKGHVVHNWKMRWFVLTASSLSYFESHENLVLKGTVVINSNSLVQNMQEYKARPHRFRVVCGDTKNATEISAPSAKCMHDWIYTIRMAIKLHHLQGRNYLHKYRQALLTIPRPHGFTHSASEDRSLAGDGNQSPTHRSLTPSKSVPLDARELPSPTSRKVSLTDSAPPATTKSHNVDYNIENSSDYKDAPPLPPQRFVPEDVEDKQVFDKTAFVEARRNTRVYADRSKRYSSLEPTDVQHIESENGVYALISKHSNRNKSDREVTDLLSSAVRAQLPLDATGQIEKWENEEEKPEKDVAGYVQLEFHSGNAPPNQKKFTIVNPPPIIDSGKTKFGYSTVVFEKEKKDSDIEFVERVKPKKHSPPLPPPKYEGSGKALQSHSSDSGLLYSTVDFTKTTTTITAAASRTGRSTPDLTQSPEGEENGQESPYVNVRPKILPAGSNIPPVVPPRRGAAAIIKEQSPTLPMRKIS